MFRTLSSWIHRLVRGRRAHSGHTPPAIDRERNLDPYCSEPALQRREEDLVLSPGELRAIRKIGVRYGASL
jgi:hypothetical protein